MSVDVAEQLGGASSASPVRAGLAVPVSQSSALHAPLDVRWLGRMNFADALQLQENIVAQKRNEPNVADTILLLEHDPVYTIGRTPDQTSLRGASHLPSSRKNETNQTSPTPSCCSSTIRFTQLVGHRTRPACAALHICRIPFSKSIVAGRRPITGQAS